jgi:predicted SAM-dependent methyltransferase
MEKLRYLNVGCGSKFHKDWVNVDMVSFSPYVQKCNLIKGIPYPDNYFKVVYHSQVLEHIPKESAEGFIRECCRVVEPGGIIRVVVPDLENIVKEYQKHLNQVLENPSEEADANYEWNVIEMYDQAVRNSSFGQVSELLKKPKLVNEDYVMHRMGYVGQNMRKVNSLSLTEKVEKVATNGEMQRKVFRRIIMQKVKGLFSSAKTKIGEFRLGGEVHYWMYDRYSLSRLLRNCGFENTKVQSPYTSDVPNWPSYELDVKENMVYDPVSLFMEARKK